MAQGPDSILEVITLVGVVQVYAVFIAEIKF